MHEFNAFLLLAGKGSLTDTVRRIHKGDPAVRENEHVFFYDESDDGNIQIAITTIVKRECETPAFKGLFFGNIRKNETE